MKKIKYEFADGIKEIEVTDEFAAEYEKLIEEEKRIERKETRRHSSLEEIEETGHQFSTGETDFVEELEKAAREEDERLGLDEERINKIIASNERRDIRVLKEILTDRQFEAFWAFAYRYRKKVDIAKKMNITEGAVRKLIKKAEEKANKAYQEEKL